MFWLWNINQAIQYSILGYHMRRPTEQPQINLITVNDLLTPKNSSEESATQRDLPPNPHLAFEKNYPKNIFIPLIEHLGEKGLRGAYEECVGTRESFQGKNVVSLAQIHRVISQEWFRESINLTALVSNMSNKILMNSKIKKKLFHLLLIRELFALPLQDPKEFKKLVSKKASEVSQSRLPDDPLFAYPSALIYLLKLFSKALDNGHTAVVGIGFQQDQLLFEDEVNRIGTGDQNSNGARLKSKQPSSKEEYKLYISRIIYSLNNFAGDSAELFDLMEEIKYSIRQRESQIRQKYKLPPFVPEWNYFSAVVVNNCMLVKRNKQKLTFSLLNQWIQEFRETTTSFKGFTMLTQQVEEETYQFHPIILICPPEI